MIFHSIKDLAVVFSVIASLTLSVTDPTWAATREEVGETTIKSVSLDELSQNAGMTVFQGPRTTRPIKIAVLDDGFKGFESAKGDTLPANTRLRENQNPVAADKEDIHGLKMAEIVAGLLNRAKVPYELHLFPSFGYGRLKNSVETVVNEGFDVVLYALVWQDGGNGDGRGFINQLVNRATSRGVLWVNASGNFARRLYEAPVERGEDDLVLLPGPNSSVQIRCMKNPKNKCSTRIMLSWNSFPENVEDGTDKDLDLVLTDDFMKFVAGGGLIQKLKIPAGERGSSLYPRETIIADLKPGLYYLRAKIRGGTFTAKDRLRISVSGDFMKVIDNTPGETIFAPADNTGVIVVGAADSKESSYSKKMRRPDLAIPAKIETEEGIHYDGSSNASAAMASRVALEVAKMRVRNEVPTRRAVLAAIRDTDMSSDASVANFDSGATATTQEGCYRLSRYRTNSADVKRILREGAVVVETTMGIKAFLDEEPATRIKRLGFATNATYGVWGDNEGLFTKDGTTGYRLNQDAIEFLRTPKNIKLCPLN